mgnify:CR=1 FL=1
MRLRLPPKQAFPHTITYKHLNGEDDWGKPAYSDSIEIIHARVDEGYDFKQTGVNATDDMPNALVVAFNHYNDDLPTFEVKGMITYNEKEFTIVKVVPLYFTSDEIIGYELEVK